MWAYRLQSACEVARRLQQSAELELELAVAETASLRQDKADVEARLWEATEAEAGHRRELAAAHEAALVERRREELIRADLESSVRDQANEVKALSRQLEVAAGAEEARRSGRCLARAREQESATAAMEADVCRLEALLKAADAQVQSLQSAEAISRMELREQGASIDNLTSQVRLQ
jgi:hypothetical protein